MTQHIVIRREEFVAGTQDKPEAMVFTQTSVNRRVPWDRIDIKDIVWMKWSGGPIVAKGFVDQIIQIEDCTPEKLRKAVRGTLLHDLEDYWNSRPERFYGMAIFCRDEEWLDHLIFPSAKGYMSSWIVLDSKEKEENWLTDIGEIQKPGKSSRSVSKSLRFAVLRRDNFTCTYCGGRPPEVKLHIDHEIPWSNGGPSEMSNLRTACSACNLGKGSTRL
jgi:hypothetical protein